MGLKSSARTLDLRQERSTGYTQTLFGRMFSVQRIRAAIAAFLQCSLSLALLRNYRRLALDFGLGGHSLAPSDATPPTLQTSSDAARMSSASSIYASLGAAIFRLGR